MNLNLRCFQFVMCFPGCNLMLSQEVKSFNVHTGQNGSRNKCDMLKNEMKPVFIENGDYL